MSIKDLDQKHAVRYEVVDDASSGQRIDNYLVKILKGVPKSRIYRMLRKGEVRVDGRRIKPTRRLAEGESVRIPPVASVAAAAAHPPAGYVEALEARIIVETDDYLALDKPTGVAVHGGSGVRLGLIETLRASRSGFLELVHRLDRDTSGVLLLAKSRTALTELHQAFRARATAKHYRLVVHGQWQGGARTVRHRLHRFVTASGERRVRVQDDGRSAQTIFTPLEVNASLSCLQAELVTGRTHQARVHALAEGHPIVGDDKYMPERFRNAEANRRAGRLMLHAESLRIVIGGERVRFSAEVPQAFEALMAGSRKP